MLKLKYGRDIVEGDALLIASGTTVPFSGPIQPAIVVDKWFCGPNRQHRFVTKKYPESKGTEDYILWDGEMYMVMEKES